MLRLITCQQATLLVEQRAEHPLGALHQSSLWLHLRYCPLCRRYEQQTQLINRLARASAVHSAAGGAGLSAEARERLQQRLAAAQRAAPPSP